MTILIRKNFKEWYTKLTWLTEISQHQFHYQRVKTVIFDRVFQFMTISENAQFTGHNHCKICVKPIFSFLAFVHHLISKNSAHLCIVWKNAGQDILTWKLVVILLLEGGWSLICFKCLWGIFLEDASYKFAILQSTITIKTFPVVSCIVASIKWF